MFIKKQTVLEEDVIIEEEEILKNLASVIKGYRTLYDYTLEELSEITGYSKSTIDMIEKGKNNMSPKSLMRLARAFDTTPSHLYYLAEAAQKNDVKNKNGQSHPAILRMILENLSNSPHKVEVKQSPLITDNV